MEANINNIRRHICDLAKELQSCKKQFEDFFTRHIDPLLIVDKFDSIIHCNKSAAKLFCSTVENLVGDEFSYPMDCDGKSIIEIEQPSGKKCTAEMIAVDIEWEGEIATLITLRDITDKKHLENELKLKTAALRAVTEQIFITDLDGKIIYVNPACEKATGFKISELVGSNPRILKSGKHNDEFYKKMWSTILSGKTWRGEIINKCRDGCLCTDDMFIIPHKNESKQIDYFIAIKKDVTERKQYEEKLSHLAHHDSLTGLPNRLLFRDRLIHGIAQAKRNKQMMAVLFIDLDGFKLINDTLGHKVGDLLLKHVSQRFIKTIREEDTIARMGGDEFTIIVQDVDPKEAMQFASRLNESLAEPFFVNGHELFVSCSIGISLYPTDGLDVHSLLKAADAAMYRAKEQGRNCYHLFTDNLNAIALERMTLEHGLRKAISRNEFLLYYQPCLDIASGTVVGAETLIRWQHPGAGIIQPNTFITLAEETGLIEEIGEWVLRNACLQKLVWQETSYPDINLAVNISCKQFKKDKLVNIVSTILDETGLDAKFLILEITESVLMKDPNEAIKTLYKLKDMGVKIYIDDFGTGYSSLNYLKQFPIDALKIDRTFIKEITLNPSDAAITAGIIAMAHSLCIKVVAEGVETNQQLEYLKMLQCDEIQGFLIGKPVPPSEFSGLIDNIYQNNDLVDMHHYI